MMGRVLPSRKKGEREKHVNNSDRMIEGGRAGCQKMMEKLLSCVKDTLIGDGRSQLYSNVVT